MGTKQNFKSALNELMAGKIAADEENNQTEVQSAPLTPAEPVFSKPVPAPAQSPVAPSPSPSPTPTHSTATNISILSTDLVIEGNIKSKSDIQLDGHIKGNVFCDGSIACGGVVEGDIHCDSLVMSGCSINGNIAAKADVTIDADSTIIGDVAAHNLVSNGRIKGNIKTTGPTTLCEHAMLMGNINAKSISLDPGAALKGVLEIQTAELSDADFTTLSAAVSKPVKKATFPVFEADEFIDPDASASDLLK